MVWSVRFVCVLFLGGLCGAEDFNGEELLSLMQTIVRGQQDLYESMSNQDDRQKSFANSLFVLRELTTRLNTNMMRVTESLTVLTETVQGSRAKMTDVIRGSKEENTTAEGSKEENATTEGAVNATKLLMEDEMDSILNLLKDISSADISHDVSCDGVYVSGVPFDIAHLKPTMPFMSWPGMMSSHAVDGDNRSMYHSADTHRPWWSVDLLNSRLIKTIDILPSQQVPDWFRDITVFIGNSLVTDGDFSSYYMVGKYPGPWDARDRVVYNLTEEICGRYVAIQGFSGCHYLLLADVKVMAIS